MMHWANAPGRAGLLVRLAVVLATTAGVAPSMAAAPATPTWQWANPLPQGNTLWAVAYGAGRYVAMGEAGAVLTSVDGLQWTVGPAVGADTWTDVLWTGDRFLAVSYPAVATSPDGVVWTLQAAPPGWGFGGAAAAHGSTVVILGTNQVAVSHDLASWDFVALPRGTQMDSVTWGGDRWVGVGPGGVGSSFDGETWQFTRPPHNLYSVAWNGSVFVAIGSYTDTVFISSDAVTWEQTYSRLVGGLNNVTWTGGEFVVLDWGGAILTSTDGSTWAEHTFPGANPPLAVCSGESRLVAVGEYGAIGWSEGGDEWEVLPSATNSSLSAVTWADDRFLALGGSTLLSSPNGLVWVSHALDDAAALLAAARGEREFLVVGYGRQPGIQSMSWTSQDGQTWIPHELALPSPLETLVWAGDRYVGFGGGMSAGPSGFCCSTPTFVATSPNGVDWSSEILPLTSPFLGIAWNGSAIVAVALGTSATSTDLEHWEIHNTEYVNSGFRAVVWSGTEFVAVTESGGFWTSPDGASWSQRIQTDTWLFGLAWTGRRFVAVGWEKGAIISTPDFRTWGHDATVIADSLALAGVASNGRESVAVGWAGSILQCDEPQFVRRHLAPASFPRAQAATD